MYSVDVVLGSDRHRIRVPAAFDRRIRGDSILRFLDSNGVCVKAGNK
jgi:hypothetical protein